MPRAWTSMLVWSVGLAACSGTPQRVVEPERERVVLERDAGMDVPSGPAVYEDESAPDGSPCTGPSECGAGLSCRGPRGCTSDWACGEAIACGEDRIAYCGCDGVTFYANSGCAGRPYLHPGACDDHPLAEVELGIPDGDEPITSEDRTCESSADCRRFEICFGASGCGVTWRCQRVRGCSGARATFCDCNGETFEAPAACPGRTYLRRGECEGMVASAEPDAGTDAGARVASSEIPDAGTRVATGRPDAGTRVAAATPDAGVRWTSTVTDDGRHTCRRDRDCRRPEVCMGRGGCGEEWTCQRPPEACMRDTQYFCDCQGRSFAASMNCPGRLYAHRGSCAIDEYIDLAGGGTH